MNFIFCKKVDRNVFTSLFLRDLPTIFFLVCGLFLEEQPNVLREIPIILRVISVEPGQSGNLSV